MPKKEPDKSDLHPILDQAKADTMRWATKPNNEMERRTFSRIHVETPFTLAVFLSQMDFIHQLLNSPIENTENLNDLNVDKTLVSDFAHDFASILLESSVAVNGQRAKLMVEMVKDMNRPSNWMGGLGSLISGQNQELEETDIEEVPKFE